MIKNNFWRGIGLPIIIGAVIGVVIGTILWFQTSQKNEPALLLEKLIELRETEQEQIFDLTEAVYNALKDGDCSSERQEAIKMDWLKYQKTHFNCSSFPNSSWL